MIRMMTRILGNKVSERIRNWLHFRKFKFKKALIRDDEWIIIISRVYYVSEGNYK